MSARDVFYLQGRVIQRLWSEMLWARDFGKFWSVVVKFIRLDVFKGSNYLGGQDFPVRKSKIVFVKMNLRIERIGQNKKH